MKKLMIWLMAAMLMVSLFGLASFAGTEITIAMPSHEAGILGYFEEQAVEFEAQTGIKVNMVTADWDSIADKILPALAAGSSAYDIVEFDNCWVAAFAETNWLLPLEDYAGEEYIEGMLPGLVDLFSSNGHLYGITWNNDIKVDMYNAQMLQDVGIANPPATWDELVEQSQKLQAAGRAKYGFIGYWEKGQALANIHTVMVRSFGGRVLDKNGNPVLDSPAAMAALQFMVDCIHKYKIAPLASLTTSQKVADEVFLKGDSAFTLQCSPFVYPNSNNPELSKVVGQVKVAPKSFGVTKYMGAGITLPEALAISAGSKHPDEAWAFLEFLTNKEANKNQSLVVGSLPIWSDLFDEPDLLALNPYWEEVGMQSPDIEGLQMVTWYGELSEIIQVEVMNALTQAKTVEQATADMIRAIEAIEK
ncbi:extracellular solute-binding protein [Candidatus Aerophobetes bacterium]|nr:extracellular solute-binding protein [Candidatus Aerophobetes bacterium]